MQRWRWTSTGTKSTVNTGKKKNTAPSAHQQECQLITTGVSNGSPSQKFEINARHFLQFWCRKVHLTLTTAHSHIICKKSMLSCGGSSVFTCRSEILLTFNWMWISLPLFPLFRQVLYSLLQHRDSDFMADLTFAPLASTITKEDILHLSSPYFQAKQMQTKCDQAIGNKLKTPSLSSLHGNIKAVCLSSFMQDISHDFECSVILSYTAVTLQTVTKHFNTLQYDYAVYSCLMASKANDYVI